MKKSLLSISYVLALCALPISSTWAAGEWAGECIISTLIRPGEATKQFTIKVNAPPVDQDGVYSCSATKGINLFNPVLVECTHKETGSSIISIVFIRENALLQDFESVAKIPIPGKQSWMAYVSGACFAKPQKVQNDILQSPFPVVR